MKYDKHEAFKRLNIPKELQKKVFVINIPRFICWLANKIGVRNMANGLYIHIFRKDFVIILAGTVAAHNDYTLAHELLGHRKQSEKLGEKYDKLSRKDKEAHAVEQGLLAIKKHHTKYYIERIKEIKDYKAGKGSWWVRHRGKIYCENVDLKKLV